MTKTLFVIAKMPAADQRDSLHQLRVLLIFIKFNILICILMEKQKDNLNPAPSRGLRHHHSLSPSQPPGEEEIHKINGSYLQRQEKGCYSNLLVDPIHTDIVGYQKFVRLPPAFFGLIKESIHQRIKKSSTNFRKPLEVGLTSGSYSDAHIFNRSLFRKKIEDGTLGLPAPEPLGERGPDLHYFLLGATHLH